jgi:EasF-like predicted methyltransferase
MHDELVRTLAAVPDGSFNFVTCAGLWGTYDDGLAWLKQPENAEKPKAILSMGSSIGNFTPDEAVDFIAQFATELGREDLMLIALDGCQDADKVYNAYNDKDGVTHGFTANGLKHANRLLGYDAFKPDLWEAVGQYDRQGSRHQAFVVPNTAVTVEGADIKKNEKVRIEESYKWPFQKAERLWHEACAKNSVIEGAFYSNKEGSYCTFSVAYSPLGITCLHSTTSYHIISLSSHHLLIIAYSPTLAQSIQNDCFIEA